MHLSSLGNYKLRKEDSYYYSGYYIADLISMHNVVAYFEGVDAEYVFTDNANVLAFVTEEEDKDIVVYNPFTVLSNTESNEILYIVSHELTHVKNKDLNKIGTKNVALLQVFILPFLLLFWFPFPIAMTSFALLAISYPLFMMAMYRRIETFADIGAVPYAGYLVTLQNIKSREPSDKFGWLTYDHATLKSFCRLSHGSFDEWERTIKSRYRFQDINSLWRGMDEHKRNSIIGFDDSIIYDK